MAKMELLYQEKDTLLHRLDPRTKLVLLWFMIILAIIWRDPIVQFVLLLLAVVVCLAAGLPLSRTLGIALGMMVFLVVLGIIQILSRGEPYFFTLGPIKMSKPGLLFAISFGFRLAAMALLFSAFMACTRANVLTEVLVKMGVPFTFAYMVNLALRFLPLFTAEMETISNAQQARGQETELNIPARIRNLLSTIKPLILGSLRRSSHIALSLELKAFGASKNRTSLLEDSETMLFAYDYALMIVGVFLFGYLMYLSVSQGFGSLDQSPLSDLLR